ncbi:MAG TPA: hypothetical protein VGZ73_31385 [Bryobacteraceae bacterium]|jgi:hypothetical protein|nr:hypothetical protein [Bryobacteraceae bacterium]
MTKKLLFVTTILLVLAFAAVAADITGKWIAEQPGRQGGPPRQTTFVLKADGAKLTGTMSAPGRGGAAPTEIELTNGKVDGNNISFEVKRQTQNGEMVSKYEGTLSGDELKLKTTRPGQDGTPMPVEMTAKRSTT